MVKQIVRDPMLLQLKSEPATEDDRQVVQDLIDTLNANRDRCVGMAANMDNHKERDGKSRVFKTEIQFGKAS